MLLKPNLIKKNQHLKSVGFFTYNPFTKDFTKHIKTIFVPVFISSLFESLINFVDIFLIFNYAKSHINNQEAIINALTSIQSFLFIYISVIMGIYAGCTIIATQYFGDKQFNKLRQIFNIRIFFAIIIALIFMIPSLLAPKFLSAIILNATHTNNVDITINIASSYLKIIAFSMPLVALDFAFVYALSDTGRNTAALWIRIITLITRIFFSWIFIYGLGNIKSFGLEGSAFGLIISRAIELILFIGICLYFKYEFCKNYYEKIWTWGLLKQVTSKTIPVFLNELLVSVSIYLSVIAVALLGAESLVAFQIANTVMEIGFTVYFGIFAMAGIVIGKTLGEKNKILTKYYSKKLISFGIILSLISAIIILISAFILPTLIYGNSSIFIIEQSKYMLIINAAWILLFGLYLTLFAIIRAGGNIFYVLLDSIFYLFFNTLLFFILVLWLGQNHHWTISQIFTLLLFTWLFKVLLYFVIWIRDKWMNILI